MRGLMFGAFVRLLKRLVRVEPPPELTIHYKMGWDDAEAYDGRSNPYKEGTKAHADWKLGYRDSRKWAMEQW